MKCKIEIEKELSHEIYLYSNIGNRHKSIKKIL